MREINKNRKSIATLAPIRPLCVPMYVSTDFAEQIGGHGKSSIFSLWERLELIYLEENNQPDKIGDTVIVNNFAQQIIFKLFSNKKTRDLAGANRVGFELINKVVRIAERKESRAAAQIRKTIEKRRTDRAFFEQALKEVFALLSGNDKDGKNPAAQAEAADFTIKAVLSAAASEGRLSHHRIEVLKRLSEHGTVSKETRNIIAELSDLAENSEGKSGAVVVPQKLLSRVFEELSYNIENAEKSSLISELSALAENGEEKGGAVVVPQKLLSRVFEELSYNIENAEKSSLISELSALAENSKEKSGAVSVPQELLSRVFDELSYKSENAEKSGLISELSALAENGEEKSGAVSVPQKLLSRVFEELSYKSENAETSSLISELSDLAENGEEKSGAVSVPQKLLSRVFDVLSYKSENAEKSGLISELSALAENVEEKGGAVSVPQKLLSRVFDVLSYKSENAETSSLISELSALAENGEEKSGAVVVPQKLLSRVFEELSYKSESAETSGLISELSALAENSKEKSGAVSVPQELLSRVFDELSYKSENAETSGLISELSALAENVEEKGGAVVVPQKLLSRVFEELSYKSENAETSGLISELSALAESGKDKSGAVVVPQELLSRVFEELSYNIENAETSGLISELSALAENSKEKSGAVVLSRALLSRVFEKLSYKSESAETSGLISELSALAKNGEEKGGFIVVSQELLSRITEQLSSEHAYYSNALLEIAAEKANTIEESLLSASEAPKTASQIADEVFGLNSVENNAPEAETGQSGNILQSTAESISDAVIFLIERTESELAADGIPPSRLDLFSRRETRLLLEKNAKRFSSEILEKFGVDSQKVLREAVSVLALANKNNRSASADESAQYPGNAAIMTTALMGRLTKYISGDHIAKNESSAYQTGITDKGGDSAQMYLLRFESYIDKIRSSNAVFRSNSADNSFGDHQKSDSFVFNEDSGDYADSIYRTANSVSASASVESLSSSSEIVYYKNGEIVENTENQASAAVYKYAIENDTAVNGSKDNPATYKAGNLPGDKSSGLAVGDGIEKDIMVASTEIEYSPFDESGIGGGQTGISSVDGSLSDAEVIYTEKEEHSDNTSYSDYASVNRQNERQVFVNNADGDYGQDNANLVYSEISKDYSQNSAAADKTIAAGVAEAHSPSGKTVPLANQGIFRGSTETPTNVTASYRDRLDEKTITALDKIISRASFAAKPASLKPVPFDLTYTDDLSDNQAEKRFAESDNFGKKTGTLNRQMRILTSLDRFPILTQSRISSSVKKSLGEKNISIGERIFSGSGYSLKNIKEDGTTVLALPEPSTESISHGASVPSPAPMEYKLREESGVFSGNSRPLKKINNFPIKGETAKTIIPGRFEDLTREEIKKITDVVYKQLQTRLKNERRRMGM